VDIPIHEEGPTLSLIPPTPLLSVYGVYGMGYMVCGDGGYMVSMGWG